MLQVVQASLAHCCHGPLVLVYQIANDIPILLWATFRPRKAFGQFCNFFPGGLVFCHFSAKA